MKAVAYYHLPLDGEISAMMIAKAREVGYPVLAVMFHVTGEFQPNTPLGMTSEMQLGLEIGEKIGELDGEMAALGGPNRNSGARAIADDDPPEFD